MDNPQAVFATSAVDPAATAGHDQSAELSVLPALIKINLRGDSGNPDFVAAVEASSGLSLPIQPNTVTRSGSSSLLWLGPDEWQWRHSNQVGNELDAKRIETLIAGFESRLAGIHAAVVDISDYYAVFQLQGANVFDVLEKGSPLDVRRALSAGNQCAQTRFGNAAVLLDRQDTEHTVVHIQVRWSYAEYLWQYLSESLLEYN